MPSVSVDLVALIGFFVIGIVAFVNVKSESKQNKENLTEHSRLNEKAFDKITKDHEELSKNLTKEISDMAKVLSEVKGYLFSEEKKRN